VNKTALHWCKNPFEQYWCNFPDARQVKRIPTMDLDAAQQKNRHSQGRIECLNKIASGSAVGTKAASWVGQVSNNRAHFFVTGVFDGQDRRRRDEDGERE
jgi:hypothetical protein